MAVGHLQVRVQLALDAHRRLAFRAGRAGHAERSGAVRGQDAHVVGQRGQALKGLELLPGEDGHLRGTEQIRAAGAADQQAATGQHGRRHVRPTGHDLPREVLGRMARRRHADQVEVADRDREALVRGAPRELVSAACGRDDLRAGRGTHFLGATHVVVVDVRLEHMGDAPAPALGGLDEPPRIALRVDQRRLTFRRDEVGRVAEARRQKRLNVHGFVAPSS